MKNKLAFIGITITLAFSLACASSDVKRQHPSLSASTVREKPATEDEKLNERIDERVEEIQRERTSKFRLRSLFGGR